MVTATETWWPIEEAPNYEINDKGHVRSKWSGKCIKHKHDGVLNDDPYVTLTTNGERIRRSVYVLLRQAQVNARK